MQGTDFDVPDIQILFMFVMIVEDFLIGSDDV